MSRKTLVIGLGGSGCRVAAAVKRMVGGKDNDIQFVGFDTDRNQEKAKGLDIVKISRDAKVGEILLGMPNWQEWFPDNDVLMNENMMDGAGQKRVLSRLAFTDTLMRRGAMDALDEAVNKLSMEDGDPDQTSLKVMIISSFAGGTGSGMFLQLPFYLRKKYLGKQFGIMDIRGLFALPDIYVSHCDYSDAQIESVYSNAYAALRELAAINVICLSENEDKRKYSMKIDELFDSEQIFRQLDGRGDKRLVTAVGKRPYDFLFFVDEYNRNRKKLKNIEEYYEMMAQITYMQVYSPIGEQLASREDNLIEDVIEADGEAFYGSAGVARLVYPYEDVVKYCALRLTSDTVDKQWNALDTEYKRQNKEEKEQKKRDTSVKITSRADSILSQVDRLLDERNENFEFLREQVRILKYTDETEMVISGEQDRAEEFCNAVKMHIKEMVDNDPQLAEAKIDCENNRLNKEKARENREDSAESILASENAIAKYKQFIENMVKMTFRSAINEVMPFSMESELSDANKPYNVNALLKGKVNGTEQVAYHPLAVRYILYSLQKKLTEEINNVRRSVSTCKANTQVFVGKDYDEKKEGINRASAVIEDARHFKTVRRDFYDLYDQELGNLEKYKYVLLQYHVYTGVLERVDALVSYYERIFDTLDQVVADNNKNVKLIAAKFATPNPNTIYVCASPEALEDVYSEVAMVGAIDNAEVYEKLNSMAYDKSQEIMRDKANTINKNVMAMRTADKREDGRAAYRVKEIFTQQVIPYFEYALAEQYGEYLDLSILDALDKDATVLAQKKAEDEGMYIEDVSEEQLDDARKYVLAQLKTKAAPYLMSLLYHARNENHSADTGMANTLDSVYWGVNDQVAMEIVDKLGLTSIGDFFSVEGNRNSDVRPDKMYDRHVICCYRGLYSVRLTEIPQFSEDEFDAGSFFSHYAKRISKMEKGRYGRSDEACTPHLDIHWHNCKYLPMIGSAKDLKDDQRAARAMWLGLMFNNFEAPYDKMERSHYLVADYMREWAHKESEVVYKDTTKLDCDGEAVRPGQYYEIFRALQQNPQMIDKLLEVTEPMLKYYCSGKSENFIFEGRRTSFMVKALVGTVPVEVEEDPELEAAGMEDKAANEDGNEVKYKGRNVLEIMLRIVKHHLADEDEKTLIRDELQKIICEYTDQMPGDRAKLLKRKIFQNSPFVSKHVRAGNELAWQLYFSDSAAELD